MKAVPLMHERHVLDERSFVEIVIWRLPAKKMRTAHSFKYRLTYVVDGLCVLRYDNETTKGDHRHIGDREEPYDFRTPEALLDDFWSDVARWRER
jgi:hypothetical protein